MEPRIGRYAVDHLQDCRALCARASWAAGRETKRVNRRLAVDIAALVLLLAQYMLGIVVNAAAALLAGRRA